ncbi:MAG: hypothetical protein UDT09_06460 [Eubacterium sp.]|nr:hypothetical protein [Eubacterium sp.]
MNIKKVSDSKKDENKDIYYMVGINGEIATLSLRDTVIDKRFCGKIIKTTEKSIIFELIDSKANVIIPIDWIEYLAPVNENWKELHGLWLEKIKN